MPEFNSKFTGSQVEQGLTHTLSGTSASLDGIWDGQLAGLTTYYAGLILNYAPTKNCGTNSTTLNVNSLGARQIYKSYESSTANQPLNAPFTAKGKVLTLVYQGSATGGYFLLVSAGGAVVTDTALVL